jgi:Calcineurin-like phosphoesterase
MVTAICRDLEAHPVESALTVTLGDYVDRGPDSRGVIERLMRNPFPTSLVALRGNHESLFESFMDDPPVAGQWRRLGGLETLHSYGVSVAPLMMGKDYEKAAEALRAALPPDSPGVLEIVVDLPTDRQVLHVPRWRPPRDPVGPPERRGHVMDP